MCRYTRGRSAQITDERVVVNQPTARRLAPWFLGAACVLFAAVVILNLLAGKTRSAILWTAILALELVGFGLSLRDRRRRQ
jgi:hypothetical protein